MDSQFSPTSSGGGITITRRSDKSLLMAFLHVMVRPFRPRLVFPKATSARGSQKLTPHRKATSRCQVTERQVNDIWVYDMTRREGDGGVVGEKTPGPGSGAGAGAAATRKRLVYFAGGGWQMPPSPNHWAFAAELVKRTPGLTVTLVSYPLAPHSPAALSMPLLRRMYNTLMEESRSKAPGVEDEKIILGGDSAGGNIAICLANWALSLSTDATSPAPAAILAVSPSTDLRHLDPELKRVELIDPLLTVPFITSTAQAWSAGGASDAEGTGVTRNAEINTSDTAAWSSSDPRVSPILADLGPLVQRGVKLHCVTGTYDILSLETHAFRDKCDKAGVEGEWLEWEGQMHCFPLAFSYGLRESKEGVDWIVNILKGI